MKGLFAEILNISISAGILIVVCILVRLVFKNMPKFVRCLMWLLVAVRLAFPFDIESPFSLLPAKEYVTVSTEAGEAYGETYNVKADNANADVNSKNKTNNKSVSKADNESDKNYDVDNEVPINRSKSTDDKSGIDIMYVLSIIWVAGVIVVLIYAIIAYLRLRRIVGDAVLLKGNIYQTEKISTAFVLGIVSPKIYVPYGLGKNELYMSVSHEKAHLARRDHLVKPLGFIIAAVYWFNPLVWVAYILLCRDIELACDEKVIKKIGYDKKREYSQALLDLSAQRNYILACPVAFGEVGINERIKNVLNMKKGKKIIIAVAAVICVVLAVCFLTYPRTSKKTSGEVVEVETSEAANEMTENHIEKVEEEKSSVSKVSEEKTPVSNADNVEKVTENKEINEEDSANGKEVEVEMVPEGEEIAVESLSDNDDHKVYIMKLDDEKDIQAKYVVVDNPDSDKAEIITLNSVSANVSDHEILYPVIGKATITRQFSDEHQGTDISAAEGTAIVSIYSGTVEDVGYDDKEGNYIAIKNGEGWTVKYSHLKDAPTLSKGDSVDVGSQVGYVGSTGQSTGPHVHIAVTDDKGSAVDPMDVLTE